MWEDPVKSGSVLWCPHEETFESVFVPTKTYLKVCYGVPTKTYLKVCCGVPTCATREDHVGTWEKKY